MTSNRQELFCVFLLLCACILKGLNAAPLPQFTDAQADTAISNQTRVDSVSGMDMSEEFIDIATKIDRVQLRPILQERITEDAGKKLFGKAHVENDENPMRKATRLRRDSVDLSTLCPDQSCIELLKKYVQWRQEHGYAYYTGVWKVGK